MMGATLGLGEASLHAATSGAPDAVAPLYGVVLYGLIGLPLGLVGGLAFSLAERWFDPGEAPLAESRALVVGGLAALWPMAGFIGRYLMNKMVYGERGVPPEGLLALVGVLSLASAALWVLGSAGLRRPLSRLRTGPGSLGVWAGLAGIGAVWAFVGAPEDPRVRMGVARPAPPALQDKPNILFLAVDTLRADALGAYGAEGGTTPNLDRLAERGVLFEQSFTQASWTRASFASLWSSRLPSGHNAATKSARLSDEVDLLSEVLQDAGVVTANFVNNINVTATFGFDQGWDVFVYEAPDYVLGGTESVFALTFYKVLHKLYSKVVSSKRVEQYYQPADVVLADVRRFIEANGQRRWMAVAHLMEPHDPYFRHPYLEGTGSAEYDGYAFGRAEHEHPDPSDADRLRGLYQREVQHLDRKVGEFLKWLEARGELDQTVVVLWSDHGEEFHEHGGFWHGQTLYDEQVHVPLVITLPGAELAGRRVPWQVRAIDVAPTLAALLGVAPSPQWEGKDLLSDLREQEEERQAIDAAWAEVEEALAALDAEPEEGADEASLDEDDARDRAEARRVQLDEFRARQESLTARRAALDFEAMTGCEVLNHPLSRTVVAEQDFEGTAISAIRMGGAKRIHVSPGNRRGLPERSLFDIVEDPREQQNLEGQNAVVCGAAAPVLVPRLDDAMRTIIEASKAAGVEGGTAEMDAGERSKLCALGYLSGPDCE